MPKIQKKIKRRYNSTTSETIQEAIDLMNTGKLSINQCCKEFDIPKGTLINRLHDNHFRNVGRPTVLSSKEEEVIANSLITVSNWGYPFSSSEIKSFVKAYLDNENRTIERFKDNLPGDEWVQNFLSRNKKKITKRFCQNLKSSKAKLSREAVSCYFDQLKVSLTGSDGRPIQPERIFNYDETNLTDDPGVRKFIFKRGIKYPDRILDTTKSSISVMFCGSATGKLLPPYVVYQASNLWDTWVKGGPARTRYNRTKSGWFDSTCFKDWFLLQFIPETRHLNGEVVLIGDNLSSHFSLSVIQAAEEHNIRFVCLPANSTHLCQPLDVAFYAPLKRKWRYILERYKSSKRKNSQTISKDQFPALLKKLVKEVIDENGTSTNLIAGFEKCGISPFNSWKVLERIPSISIDNIESSVNSAVLEVLTSFRGNSNDNIANSKKKRSKINVTPGKSILPEDFVLSEERENLNYNLSLESHVTEEIVIANSSPQFTNGVDQVAEQIVITNTTLESIETAGQDDSSKEDDDDTEEITEEELFALVMEARS